ncbi:SKI family transcriptional corepressor 1 [Chelonia mydas]|uniref:SKI family transcriptional corepressor 1 n=1 Tax=Chelonia mydas TaxID=8469 RepID=M7C6I5_CHEMY|nr:SKI family transcriptional corepressor 1 [Chelonia mydas]
MGKDNFQDQMKRELAYREEMVQQLQIAGAKLLISGKIVGQIQRSATRSAKGIDFGAASGKCSNLFAPSAEKKRIIASNEKLDFKTLDSSPSPKPDKV